MTVIDRRTFLLAGLALGSGAAAATAADDRAPTLFQQVIPKPTGQNGYEELVAAADELRASKLFSQAEALMGGLSLSLRRRVLADPPVRRALALLQQGLGKPVFSPRESLSLSTPLPDLAGFRQLARLLDMQQHVLLGDGRVADALATLRVGLRLGQAVQTDTLISGLVGIAVAAIVIRPIGEHLEQLAVRDCGTLYQVCLERLAQPPLLAPMIEAERRNGKSALSEATTDLKTLDTLDDPAAADGGAGLRQLKGEITRLSASPNQLAATRSEAEKLLEDYYQQVLAECGKPSWQRSWPAPPAGSSIAARLAALIIFDPQQVSSRYTTEEARIRLLAVHAAILAYRWERDQAPPSLAVLSLGDLVVDSFTGQPLVYGATGRKYRLASAGEEGGPPVSVTPE